MLGHLTLQGCTLELQAWKFFEERIAIEEQQLQRFFGSAYMHYASKTPTLIPFIK